MAAVTLEPKGKVPAADDYYDLGNLHWPITTTNPDAQVWFNRGLTWLYSFNHLEAAACFKQVITHDPTCAIGYWGRAFASGPNYNKVWKAFDEKDLKMTVVTCWDLVQKAKEFAPSATPLEEAFVEAIQHRFPSREVLDDYDPSVRAYADAMRQVYRRFGEDDLNVVTLSADAVMNLTPWKLYRAQTGEPDLSTPVLEVEEMMERDLAHPDAKHHPGILHMYIHFIEMSRTPEKAVMAADYLRDLVPEGGHIHHMPSLIDILVGDWRRSIHTNLKATIADEKYLAREGARNFYSMYRMHNFHSLIYAAMMAGQKEMALEISGRMETTLTDDVLLVDSPPLADWLEYFKSVRVHVLIRFGMWDELKALAPPENKELYCTVVATTHYGRAIAWAATGDVDKADQERELFRAAAARVPPSRLIFPNKVTDTLQIATAMLDGEIEYRRGNHEAAFESLRLAIARDDRLVYGEPWGWMLPTRHPYAALLLEQGRVEEAARVYAEDLGFDDRLVRAHQNLNNVWALHGYHECLVRLGRTAEATIIAKQLLIASAGADIAVQSCFCRLEKTGQKTCCSKTKSCN